MLDKYFIEALISSSEVQQFCISRICVTRPYLKCCYISFQNFLIEILEVTDISQANEFAFFDDAQNLSTTKWVAIGLRADNLDSALQNFQNNGIIPLEQYTSINTRYAKGYKHRSASLNLHWFNKIVYVSEYDSLFFQERENGITHDVSKKLLFSVENPELFIKPFLQPPAFLQFNGLTPELRVQLDPERKSFFTGINSLECGWITFKF